MASCLRQLHLASRNVALVPSSRHHRSSCVAYGTHGINADAPAPGEWEPTISLDLYENAKEYMDKHPIKSDTLAQHLVTEIMYKPPYTASPSETVGELVDAFKETGGIPVINKAQQVIGVISRVDIEGKEPDTLVAEAMTAPAVSATPDKRVYQVAGMMLKHKVRHVPIVNAENKLVGEVAAKDIFVALSE